MKKTLFFTIFICTFLANFAITFVQKNECSTSINRYETYSHVAKNNYIFGFSYLTLNLPPHSAIGISFIKSEDYGLNFEERVIIDLQNEEVHTGHSILKVGITENNRLYCIYKKKVVDDYYNDFSYLNRNLYDIILVYSDDFGQTFSSHTIKQNCTEDEGIYAIDDNIIEFWNNVEVEEKLEDYAYFVNSFNSTVFNFRFFGQDEFYGKLHTNDNFYIRSIGGWPTFHGKVTTSKRIIDFSTGAPAEESTPVDDIFLNGYEEETAGIKAKSYTENDFIDSNCLDNEGNDIVYVKLNGSSFTSMVANITERQENFTVYSSYPDHNNPDIAIGDSIGVNTVTVKDTVWAEGVFGSIINNSSYCTNCDLWIEGNLQGKASFISKKNIYVTNDLTYENTIVGQKPDDPENLNQTDFLTLVAYKDIIVKYKHKDPFTNQIVDANCDGVNVYGSIVALGVNENGEQTIDNIGGVKAEYLHPRPGLINFTKTNPETGETEEFTNVGLHKYLIAEYNEQYETTNIPVELRQYIWPGDTDFYGYNPVGPEATGLAYMRGDLKVYGTIFINEFFPKRVSGNDTWYILPQANFPWDIERGFYGGFHNRTGFGMNYIYDTRLEQTDLPNFPKLLNTKIATKPFDLQNLETMATSSNIYDWNFKKNYILKYYYNQSEYFVKNYSWNNFDNELNIEKYTGLTQENFSTNYDNDDSIKFIKRNNNKIFVFTKTKIITFDFETDEFLSVNLPESLQNKAFAVEFNASNELIFCRIKPENQTSMLVITKVNSSGIILEEISQPVVPLNFNNPVLIKLFNIDNNGVILAGVTCKNADTGNDLFTTFVFNSSYTGADDNIAQVSPAKKLSISNYPNPFNPSTTFSLNIPILQNVNLEIYNIKGQKVKTLVNNQKLVGQKTFSWNGKNDAGSSVASGVYFYKLKTKQKVITNKLLLLK